MGTLVFLSHELRDELREAYCARFLPVAWVLVLGGFAGWGWLGYRCIHPPAGIGTVAMLAILSAGALGALGTMLAFPATHHRTAIFAIVCAGWWIANGLGVHWIVLRVRRILKDANQDEETDTVAP